MAMQNEYCLIRDGVVADAIVSDEAFAVEYAGTNGFVVIQRPSMSVGVGHKYHDAKFFRDVPVYDQNGVPTGVTNEEEITE
jgi:hypothetical protein